MTNTELIQGVFSAFGKGDVAGILAAMDDNITWLEPGDPAQIPFAGNFKGKNDVMKMFGIEHNLLKVLTFNPLTYIENDNMVVVLGNDSATVLDTGKTYKTDWTMAFTITNSLISNVQVYMDTATIAAAFVKETQSSN